MKVVVLRSQVLFREKKAVNLLLELVDDLRPVKQIINQSIQKNN